MTNLRNLLVLALVLVGLGGCFFEHPLTGTASTNIDTRLLGVFEFKEKIRKKEREDGEEVEKIQRVAVLPKNEDEYLIYYRDYSQEPVKTLTFTGWISRVDEDYYLTFRDETPDSSTLGRYGFLKFEWKWPGNFLIYFPDAESFKGAASPYAMRRTLRTLRKGGALLPYQGTYWNRIARIWWDRNNPEPLTTVPKEFETGLPGKADSIL